MSRRAGARRIGRARSCCPDPADDKEALVAIYAARVGRWRGIFAHHSWIVVKEEGAPRYTRYDEVGWGSPVRTDGWPPDGRWFGNVPKPHRAPDRRGGVTHHSRNQGGGGELSLPQLRRVSGVARAEFQYLRRPCDAVRAGARRGAAADRHRQGLAADERHRRAHAEPHRHPAFARRLCGHHGWLGRGRGARTSSASSPASTCAARP